jgi:hypothetical protein
VQFTRNPDGIAGALDSIRYLKAGTTLRSAYTVELSHMFFAPAVVRWWSWPSHPPIEERIRRAHPRFLQEDYRRTRHAQTYRDGRVAVLDGAGNVVKVMGGLAIAAAIVEAPRAEHVDYARRLLERLPQDLRRRLASPEGAQEAILELLHGPGRTGGRRPASLPAAHRARAPGAEAARRRRRATPSSRRWAAWSRPTAR